MIIGNDKINKINKNNNPITNNISNPSYTHEEAKYKDASNRTEMLDKSMIMLQERYQNGLISYEEFTKQCEKLNKLRRK